MTGRIMMCGHASNGVEGESKWPVCVICAGLGNDAYRTPVPVPPNLEGRMARCSCGETVPSDPKKLAFFEFRGEGSSHAVGICKCGYHRVAHEKAHMRKNVPSNRLTVVEQGKCAGFEARGPAEFDSFYCGCRGWD